MKPVSAILFAGALACASVQPFATADAGTYREKILHTFGSGTDGAYPYAALTNVKGILYGTTVTGGNSGNGTVFKLDLSTGTESVVYSFCSQTNCADGSDPFSSALSQGSTLYGTTAEGGAGFNGSPNGTVFSLDPGTDAEKVLYSFCQQQNCPDGAAPTAGVIRLNGTLYGTTEGGGGAGWGTAFSFNLKTGKEKVLYSFCSQPNCIDGQSPEGVLVSVNGMLYGTTGTGGAFSCGNGENCGTIFSIDLRTGTESVLHSFGNGSDGRIPQASLVAANGLLYGATFGGGAAICASLGCGTVFTIDPNTGVETVLYSFAGGVDGQNPAAGLIIVNGVLYGTTSEGGSTDCGGTGCGTVYSVDPNTGQESVLYAFRGGNDGENPQARLTAIGNKLYGTTLLGGANGTGTMFVLKRRQ